MLLTPVSLALVPARRGQYIFVELMNVRTTDEKPGPERKSKELSKDHRVINGRRGIRIQV